MSPIRKTTGANDRRARSSSILILRSIQHTVRLMRLSATRAHPLIKFIGFAESRACTYTRARGILLAVNLGTPLLCLANVLGPYSALFANKIRMRIKRTDKIAVNSYQIALVVK